MRKGTVAWHKGKHPVVECFTPFLADLEELVGLDKVSHGQFVSVHYHPKQPEYTSQYCDANKTLIITGKYDGHSQRFHVDVRDQELLPIIDAFVKHYPDKNFMQYLFQATEKEEPENRLLPPDSC
jgi:hypothetical protein